MVEYFEIGQISNTHGLKGELKVRSFAADEKKFEELESILIDIKGDLKKYYIEKVRYQKDNVLVKLKGIDSIDDAEKLKGYYIKIHRSDATELEDDEYFIADLIGIDVYNGNQLIGSLKDIFSTGGSDVYVIKRSNKKDLLLPAIESVVKSIDINSRKIYVEIPGGIDDEV